MRPIRYEEIVAHEKSSKRGKFIRTSVLTDTRFCCMIDDMENPPEWAIKLGLVKRVARPFLIEQRTTTVFHPNGPQQT